MPHEKVVSDVHPLNDEGPMFVRAGRETVTNAVHPLKALVPRVVAEPIVTVESAVKSENVLLPTVMTLGSTTVSRVFLRFCWAAESLLNGLPSVIAVRLLNDSVFAVAPYSRRDSGSV